MTPDTPAYRGRLAPSPTGYLHLGHARTFWVAQERARARGGTLVLRNEDLDGARCKPEYVTAMYEDLRWFGFEWQEGPDVGGTFAPYDQSGRMPHYRTAFERLQDGGFVYPCICSRKDIAAAASAPQAGDDETIYPGTCRPKDSAKCQLSGVTESTDSKTHDSWHMTRDTRVNWRFRVPDGEEVTFTDGNFGPQSFVAGRDFGDFVVWRQDDFPAYQLACVVDDAAMRITEVVRGADLLVSTARQLLLYRVLGLTPPAFFHCELMKDPSGVRLAKRHDALSLRTFKQNGASPESLRRDW